MSAIIELFELILIILHKRLFGEIVLDFNSTGRHVMLDFIINGQSYAFISTQYKMCLRRKGLLKCCKTHYVYKVEVLNHGEGNSKFYGHMCPKLLYKSSYPHRLAIDEHVKTIMRAK